MVRVPSVVFTMIFFFPKIVTVMVCFVCSFKPQSRKEPWELLST